MPSFGEKLRHERESRDTAIEEIAGTTKIQLSYLEALEQNEFDALPGPAFGKLYIRAYAEVLGFDPRPLIDDYDRERQQRGQQDSSRLSPQQHEPAGPEDRARARQERFARVLKGEHSQPRPQRAVAERDEADNEGLRVQEPPETKSTETPESLPAVAAATAESETEPVQVARDEPAPVSRAADSTIETGDDEEVRPPEREQSEPPEDAGEPSREATEPIRSEDPQTERPAAPTTVQTGSAPFAATPRRQPGLGWSIGILAAVALLVVIVWISTAMRRTNDQPAGPSTTETSTPAPLGDEAAATPEPTIPPPPPPESGSPAAARPDAAAGEPAGGADSATDPVRPSDSAAAASDHLSVSESGVGRRIVNHRLEGRSERFEEGSVVWFSTRVLGGRRGEQIRHVWFRNGKAVQSIELPLGGPHWRTQSSKTLWGTGDWRVEARDAANRVLATATFSCAPAS
jgi:cytoskeleton protein RodZ